MKSKLHRVLILGAVCLPTVASNSFHSSEGQGKTIILYAFSTMEDGMKGEIIPVFQREARNSQGPKSASHVGENAISIQTTKRL